MTDAACSPKQRQQIAQRIAALADGGQAGGGGGDVLLEVGLAHVAAEIAVGAEGLHETLGGAEVEGLAEFEEGDAAMLGIGVEQVVALAVGERDVGIEKE